MLLFFEHGKYTLQDALEQVQFHVIAYHVGARAVTLVQRQHAERCGMSTKKQNKVDSVRQQWTQQRKGEMSAREETPVSRGSHFAKPIGSSGIVETIKFDEIDADDALFSIPAVPTPMVPSPSPTAVPTSGDSVKDASDMHRHLKIVGASGEMPAIPRKATKNPAALPYSRYNKRYLTESSNTPFSAPLFEGGEDPSDALAYVWKPYLAYGLVCVVTSIVWGVVTRFALSNDGVPVDGDISQTCGLALLCLIVVGGVGVAVATAMVTLRNNEDVSGGDVFASSLGKTMLMMLIGIAVWFAMMALVLFLPV